MATVPKKESITQSTIVRIDDTGTVTTEHDKIAVEEPLEIRLGNNPFVVTMRTPGHDDELAAGFFVTEGIVRQRSDIKEISRCPTSLTPENTVRIDLKGGNKAEGLKSNRVGAISASCGVCGKTSIESVQGHFPSIQSKITIERNLLLQLPDRLRASQDVFDKTGGLHSAGIFDLEGNLVCLREDVGRHNALDKVIGYAFLNNLLPLDKHVLVVSGRVAFEIMQKALAAQLAIVAAISAPSSLAVTFALHSGQTLVGFLRKPRFNVYSHPHRIR
ncbi:MAG: formate dehydrogenase accessory sulfurtransferase FdhD [Verrucomicrobia bacterium]|nr:formate dehydrogenase accessory sulfurtransferase FdhD [Verrucomicrobiota bacterium]MDA1068002.1 formate dehydrogenase accessory sulfurtransferase FdhD [Verrucomicrobiota bacterium]